MSAPSISPPGDGGDGSPGAGGARPANDNASVLGQAVVRVPRGRSYAAYARSENVILPLRFAQRMPGWSPDASANR
jgi:hypothetical protein